MLTHTSETAIRALVYLTLRQSTDPLTPTQIAEEIDASASYLAKILRMLGKAGIVNARRGAQGGVILARRPESISLLQIMEACQGLLICNYCETLVGHTDPVCAFHESMVEVQKAMTDVLEKWTLADMAARPFSCDNRERCRINVDPSQICGGRSAMAGGGGGAFGGQGGKAGDAGVKGTGMSIRPISAPSGSNGNYAGSYGASANERNGGHRD